MIYLFKFKLLNIKDLSSLMRKPVPDGYYRTYDNDGVILTSTELNKSDLLKFLQDYPSKEVEAMYTGVLDLKEKTSAKKVQDHHTEYYSGYILETFIQQDTCTEVTRVATLKNLQMVSSYLDTVIDYLS